MKLLLTILEDSKDFVLGDTNRFVCVKLSIPPKKPKT